MKKRISVVRTAAILSGIILVSLILGIVLTAVLASAAERTITVKGDATRSSLVAGLVNSYFTGTKATAEEDKTLNEYVLVIGSGGTTEKIHFSHKLVAKLQKLASNPRAGEGLLDICPTQARQLIKAVGPMKATAKGVGKPFKVVTVDANCPACKPEIGGKCYLTEYGTIYDSAYCDAQKPRGSVASKIQRGRVQIVIYNGEANPYLLEKAQSRALRLAGRAAQGPQTGVCDYHLHTITSPDAN